MMFRISVDIHDRRLVVLSAEHAREWEDPETTPERAAEIVKDCCRSTDNFT
jgi:putative SOS response-associated peptidase YedK